MQYFKVLLIVLVGIVECQFSDAGAFWNQAPEGESHDAAVFGSQTSENETHGVVLVNETYNSASASFRERLFKNGPCEVDQYRCRDDQCIERKLLCDGRRDCTDESDEKFCNTWEQYCPNTASFYCGGNSNAKCIPSSWICDGRVDCHTGRDERDCSTDFLTKPLKHVQVPKQNALKWLRELQRDTSVIKYNGQAHHVAVALHLADRELSQSFRTQLAVEVSLQFLSRLVLKQIKDVPSSELAQFVNAFLATCIDPRRFFVPDLVAELRRRVDVQNDTNPFLFIALCNAGDPIQEEDIQKLHEAFNSNHRDLWTDIQAYSVMALACAATQPQTTYDIQKIGNLTMELKKKQLPNGAVDNLKTTALVMQALFAAEETEDEENFDEEKAIKLILSEQLNNGSFGDVVNTYYALPVLNYKSLININMNHCPKQEDDMTVKDLIDQGINKWYVQYSLWIGDQRDLQKTLRLRVQTSTSLFGVMKAAANTDITYSFKFNMKDGKPYIYSISDIQDDPENQRFWFPYITKHINGTSALVQIKDSPADIIPSSNQHVIYWYKTGTWK